MANYFYNKAIVNEYQHDKTMEKIIIEDNKVKCDNAIIRADIEQKIKKINIKIIDVVFYVSLCDYGVLDETINYKNIKHLSLVDEPIYKKDTNIADFLIWYAEHFNNNKIDVYETSRFTKREKSFNENDKCLKSVKYEITNHKFHNFNQLFYHAGDNADLQRFGILYSRSMFKFNINTKIPQNAVTHAMIDVTLDYLFNYMKKGVMVGIQSNKLILFLPFSKHNYQNDYYDELYFTEDDRKNLKKYKQEPGKIDRKTLFKAVYDFYNKNGLRTNGINPDRTKWVANDCFFRNEFYEGDKNESLYEDMFSTLCKERVLPDCIFFLNLRDHPMLRNDRKHPYESITDKDIPSPYIDAKFAPIFSIGSSTEHEDIPMVTQDDWLRISQKYFPDDCKNGYIEKHGQNITTAWKDKKAIAIFRGSATGCGVTVETNNRIKACDLSLKYPTLLDAGLTSLNRKIKKHLNKPITLVDTRELKKYEKPFINTEYKSTFKYILTIDGHVSAFRLSHEFSLKSVLLLPKSKFTVWYSNLLVPYVHFVPVEHDLSNLIDIIEWCKNNDKKCEVIAQNGYDLYISKMGRDGALDYMQKELEKIVLYDKPKTKIAKICIIVSYRDDAKHERLQQKRLFLYYMNKLLKNYSDAEYAIMIVEQAKGEIFNIGKTKNIGFDYFDKKGIEFDNYIFSDVDMLPDNDLMEYYFKITDGMNSLATRGTRYSHTGEKPFMGGVISCTKDVFKKINGYSLMFSRGWGGEDDSLMSRCALEGIINYVPSKGAVMDLEEKTLTEKMSEIKDTKDMKKWEYLSKYPLYKEDGLSTLEYEILEDLSYDNMYHIIVDLHQEEYEREHEEQFDVSKFKMEDYDNYVKLTKRIVIEKF